MIAAAIEAHQNRDAYDDARPDAHRTALASIARDISFMAGRLVVCH